MIRSSVTATSLSAATSTESITETPKIRVARCARNDGRDKIITFEPDSPWEVGQLVVFREGDKPIYRKVVTAVEHSDDGTETQYQLVNPE